MRRAPNVGLKSIENWLVYAYDHVVAVDLTTTARAKQRAATSDHCTRTGPPPLSGGLGVVARTAMVSERRGDRPKDALFHTVSTTIPAYVAFRSAARQLWPLAGFLRSNAFPMRRTSMVRVTSEQVPGISRQASAAAELIPCRMAQHSGQPQCPTRSAARAR